MSSLIVIGIVIVLAGFGVLGDYFIKLSGNGPSYIAYSPFFLGMLIYALSAVGWFYAMKHLKLGTLGVFYSLTTVILLMFVGIFYFKEQLTTYEIIGILLAIVSIIILSQSE